jgi:hypothetical protein
MIGTFLPDGLSYIQSGRRALARKQDCSAGQVLGDCRAEEKTIASLVELNPN